MTIAITSIVIVLLVVVDQLTKYFVLLNLKPIGTCEVINGFVQFHYVENSGAAFGIFSDKTWALSVVTGIIIIAGLVFLFSGKAENKLQRISIIMILAGGMGNLIDRIFRHYVVDFIEFTFTNFAVFNFADCCVTIGCILLIISVLLDFSKDRKKTNE